VLSTASAASAYYGNSSAASYIPVVIFACVSLVLVVVGVLGTNGAVSKIWGTK